MSAAITAAVIVAGGAAYAANKQGKSADKANKAMRGPWNETSKREPWGAAMPYLEGALGENQRVYQEALANYQRASRRGGGGGRRGRRGRGGGGGGGGDLFGSGTMEVANRFKDRAMNRTPLLSRADDYVSSTLGAGEGGPFGGNEVFNELYRRLTADSAATDPADAAGRIPDSMEGSGFFNDEMRRFFDPAGLDPANDPTLAPYVAALRREMGEDLDAQLDDVGDDANMVGMYGGSGRALEAARTREEGQEALANQLAAVYMGARESNLGRRMQGLGMVSDRDLALMDRNESGRLNDLDRLQMLGGSLTGERQWGTEAAMGLHDQEMGDLGNAFGMFQGMDQARAQAQARAAAMAESARARRSAQARQDALMPMNIFGDYLKGLGVLTDLGPTSSTSSGAGMRGGGGYVDSGPGAAAAGLSSLGGSMMALYGMGAFDRNRTQQPRTSGTGSNWGGGGWNGSQWID